MMKQRGKIRKSALARVTALKPPGLQWGDANQQNRTQQCNQGCVTILDSPWRRTAVVSFEALRTRAWHLGSQNHA